MKGLKKTLAKLEHENFDLRCQIINLKSDLDWYKRLKVNQDVMINRKIHNSNLFLNSLELKNKEIEQLKLEIKRLTNNEN